MATDRRFIDVDTNMVVAAEDFQNLVDTPADQELDLIQSLVRSAGLLDVDSAFVLGLRETVAVTAGAGSTRLVAVATTPGSRKKAAVMARGGISLLENEATGELATWRNTDDGFSAVPFEQDGTSVYQVALLNNDFPVRASATLVDGDFRLDRWAHGVGERRPALTVTEPAGPGNGLRLTLSTAAAQVIAWTDGAQSRPAIAWLNSPVTTADLDAATGEAIFKGTLDSDGVDVFIDLPHYFGQPPASFTSVGVNYTIFVPGLTISHKPTLDLTTVLDTTASVREYIVLAEYDSSTALVDHTMQQVVATLQLLTILLETSIELAQALRAGARLGDYEATRDWTDPGNVTVVVGGSETTLTFADILGSTARAYIFTGTIGTIAGRQPRICTAFAVGGEVVTMPHSLPTDTYHVIAEHVADGSVARARLVAVDDATFLGFSNDQDRRLLRVFSFDFTTGTGAVAATVGQNLNGRRGIADVLIGSSTASAPDGRSVLESVELADLLLEFLGRDSTGTTFSTSVAMRLQRDPTQTTDAQTLLELPGVNGALDGGAVPSASERSGVRLGGDADYELVAFDDGTDKFLELDYDTTDKLALKHDRLGGNAVDSTGRVIVEDVHLIGNGKDVTRQVSLPGGTTNIKVTGTPAWEPLWKWDAAQNRWEAFQDTPDPVVVIGLDLAAGSNLREVRVRGGMDAGGGAADLLRLQLVQSNPTVSTPTEVILATADVPVSGGPETETALSTGGHTVVVDRTYFVRATVITGAGGPQVHAVQGMEMDVRVFEIGQ